MLLTLMLMIEFALLGGKLMLLTLVSWKKISYNSTSGELFLSFDNICGFHHLYTNCDLWTKQSTLNGLVSIGFMINHLKFITSSSNNCYLECHPSELSHCSVKHLHLFWTHGVGTWNTPENKLSWKGLSPWLWWWALQMWFWKYSSNGQSKPHTLLYSDVYLEPF